MAILARRHGHIASDALRSLAVVVGEMHRDFADHVELQQREGGFLDVLARAAPRYLSMVDHLSLEHEELAAEMLALRLRIITAAPEEFERLAAIATSISQCLEEHQALEREMLEDAFDSGAAA